MELKKLEWDTNFFGYEISSFNNVNNDVFDLDKIFEQAFVLSNNKLVYIFSDKKLDVGLEIIDTKVTFKKRLDVKYDLFDSNICSFEDNKFSFLELKKIALQSGVYSRFKLDENFVNGEYENLYNEWIYNSVYKGLSFCIPIYLVDERIAGFTTLEKLSNSTCNIGLVGVDKLFRGNGIGKKILSYSEFISVKNNFEEMQVITQKNNIPAMELYKSLGYKYDKEIYIYHLWNK